MERHLQKEKKEEEVSGVVFHSKAVFNLNSLIQLFSQFLHHGCPRSAPLSISSIQTQRPIFSRVDIPSNPTEHPLFAHSKLICLL